MKKQKQEKKKSKAFEEALKAVEWMGNAPTSERKQ